MKRKNAKELLAESFRELAETKNIDKITVKDIVDNCGYSPATFYRNYKDKYDLIAWYYSEKVFEIQRRVGKEDGYTWQDAYRDGTQFYSENKAYLANLFTYTSGLDSFIHNMTDINYESCKEFLLRYSSEEELDWKTDMQLHLYCLGASKFISEWVLDQIDLTEEQLTEVLVDTLPFKSDL